MMMMKKIDFGRGVPGRNGFGPRSPGTRLQQQIDNTTGNIDSNRSTILLVILTTVASHSHVMKLLYFHWSKNRYRLLIARNQVDWSSHPIPI